MWHLRSGIYLEKRNHMKTYQQWAWSIYAVGAPSTWREKASPKTGMSVEHLRSGIYLEKRKHLQKYQQWAWSIYAVGAPSTWREKASLKTGMSVEHLLAVILLSAMSMEHHYLCVIIIIFCVIIIPVLIAYSVWKMSVDHLRSRTTIYMEKKKHHRRKKGHLCRLYSLYFRRTRPSMHLRLMPSQQTNHAEWNITWTDCLWISEDRNECWTFASRDFTICNEHRTFEKWNILGKEEEESEPSTTFPLPKEKGDQGKADLVLALPEGANTLSAWAWISVSL